MAEALGAGWRTAIDPELAGRLRRRLPLARILLLPLLYRLASQGWVCVSANYRLRPAAQHPDHLIDLKKVIAWVRIHCREYGGDPAQLFVSGSSAGALMASLAALTPNHPAFQPGFEDADTSVTAAIGLNGWYGGYYGPEDASSAASPPVPSSMPSCPAPSTPSTCSVPSASSWSSTPSRPSPPGCDRAPWPLGELPDHVLGVRDRQGHHSDDQVVSNEG